MNRDDLLELFVVLAQKLESQRSVGDVHLAGGAAMLLAYGSDLATGDADAQFAPNGPIVDAVRAIAYERNLPTTWLNEQAAMYFSPHATKGKIVFDHPFLRVTATSPEHLLAMKVLAARSTRDAVDAQRLVTLLNITTADQVVAIVQRFFPTDDPLPIRTRIMIAEQLGLT